MSYKVPDTVWLFRMVHWDNLAYILQHGLHSSQHSQQNPDYIFIGDKTLTEQRKEYSIPLAGAGSIGEYVAFYFMTLSPMLLNIKTGHRGIKQRPQSDIIYLCCKLDNLESASCEYVFCDGHAKDTLTKFYHNKEHLDQVDWTLRWERYWRNTDEDYDRMRRKQAELLVRHHVPPKCIDAIVVFDEEKRNLVVAILENLELSIPVHINPQGKFYY